jgi:hypothetical protein
MLVINGYDTSGSLISYIDPLQSSFQSASHSWLLSGSNHTWTHSRYQILS